MCPSKVAEGGQRGWIVPIGGAEDKENDKRVLRRFFDLCGGPGAEIAVIPTASRLNETGGRYEQIFGGMGARNVNVLDFDTRRDAHERNRIARIEQAVQRVLEQGLRTADIWSEGTQKVGTAQMGDAVVAALAG